MDGLKRELSVLEGKVVGGSISQNGSLYSFSTIRTVNVLSFRGAISSDFNFFTCVYVKMREIYTYSKYNIYTQIAYIHKLSERAKLFKHAQ